MDFRDRVAIVTGASSGIGWVTARAFASRGAVVVAVARREENLRRLIEECRADSPDSGYLAGDLGEREFAERIVADTLVRHGRVDVLVNNAAMAKHKLIYHLDPAEAERVMAVNFLSCVWTTLAVLPAMVHQGGGTIVNVSSVGGRIAPPREAIYAASKAAMDAFTAGLWNDLAGSNVHCGLVIPGAIDTEIWQKQDEPNRYRGAKHPPQVVTDAIFDVIEKRRREVMAPKRDLSLWIARVLRRVAPGLLLRGIQRMDPVPEEAIERARARGANRRI